MAEKNSSLLKNVILLLVSLVVAVLSDFIIEKNSDSDHKIFFIAILFIIVEIAVFIISLRAVLKTDKQVKAQFKWFPRLNVVFSILVIMSVIYGSYITMVWNSDPYDDFNSYCMSKTGEGCKTNSTLDCDNDLIPNEFDEFPCDPSNSEYLNISR